MKIVNLASVINQRADFNLKGPNNQCKWHQFTQFKLKGR